MFSDYEYETGVAYRRIRRAAIIALGLAFVHVVFGAIVRISGSGMGCGDHWPTCAGYWIPPMSRPDLVIEVTHRYLASVLSLAVLSLAFIAWRDRDTPRVAGALGPMRSAFGALAAVLAAAILGGVTVKMQNATVATVAHWCVAMTLLAMLVVTVVRSTTGPADDRRVSANTARGAAAGAVLAGLAVSMGGVTAKFAGAPIACLEFPLCGANPDVPSAAVWVQITHRAIAILLFLHLLGTVIALRKRTRTEAPIVVRTAAVAFGFVVFQMLVAGAMIGMKLPAALRSVHQAVGVSIWITTFAFAYAAWVGSRPVVEQEDVLPVRRSSGQRKTIARPSFSARELE
jgi:cytochrome c oxidase assembly protein subunit 15